MTISDFIFHRHQILDQYHILVLILGEIMSSTSHDPASLTLAISFLLAAYLTYRSLAPPNPNPSSHICSLSKDVLALSFAIIQARRLILLFLWIPHVLVTFFFPAHPTLLCPKPENLSRSLSTWSFYTTIMLTIILIAAPIRLLAFRQLGPNFTFRLAKPHELITTGLYACVQHPSYTANWLILISNMALLLRLDGVVGCLLPSPVVRWGMRIWPVILIWLGYLGLQGLRIRVQDEEIMLQSAFGREWEEYDRKTKRFIPGVF